MPFFAPVWSAAMAAASYSGFGSRRPLTMALLSTLSQSVCVITTRSPGRGPWPRANPFDRKVRAGDEPVHPRVVLMVVDADEPIVHVRTVSKRPSACACDEAIACDHTARAQRFQLRQLDLLARFLPPEIPNRRVSHAPLPSREYARPVTSDDTGQKRQLKRSGVSIVG